MVSNYRFERLVFLMGESGHGKDTAAKGLAGYERMALADPVRRLVSDLYDLPFERLKGLTEADRVWRRSPHPNLSGLTPVQAMQHLAMAARELDDLVWVKKLFSNAALRQVRRCVVTDCRFRVELEACKAKGGVVVFIERPGLVRTDMHVSEDVGRLKSAADYVVVNDGTESALQEKVEQAVSEWYGDREPTAKEWSIGCTAGVEIERPFCKLYMA